MCFYQKGTENTMISATFPYQKKRKHVLGREMAYIEVGSGDPIVFLHGNPASSYTWRNVIPHLEGLGRCIAPDLIGMGDSQKLPASGPASYTFVEHRSFLDALLDELEVHEQVTFVMHDWGASFGFDWARRHPASVKGLAYIEANVRPFTLEDFPEFTQRGLQMLRSETGEQMILEQNFFIERALPPTILRGLTDEEMAQYRRPFIEPGEGRRPMLSFPRQVPINGEPADVAEIYQAYARWLEQSPVPKLFINCDHPSAILTGTLREYCRTWPAQTEVTMHAFRWPQEDCPDELGSAIANWLRALP
jgi:haloalkane dehalogenase